jgi:hypothetical protein
VRFLSFLVQCVRALIDRFTWWATILVKGLVNWNLLGRNKANRPLVTSSSELYANGKLTHVGVASALHLVVFYLGEYRRRVESACQHPLPSPRCNSGVVQRTDNNTPRNLYHQILISSKHFFSPSWPSIVHLPPVSGFSTLLIARSSKSPLPIRPR